VLVYDAGPDAVDVWLCASIRYLPSVNRCEAKLAESVSGCDADGWVGWWVCEEGHKVSARLRGDSVRLRICWRWFVWVCLRSFSSAACDLQPILALGTHAWWWWWWWVGPWGWVGDQPEDTRDAMNARFTRLHMQR
jgi:hypothetical protein